MFMHIAHVADVSDDREAMRLVEARRRKGGLTQDQVAAACGISQGQYSKMRRRRAPVGRRCARALRAWLERDGPAGADATPVSDGSALRLAEAIRSDVSRLAAMLGAAGVADATGRGGGG